MLTSYFRQFIISALLGACALGAPAPAGSPAAGTGDTGSQGNGAGYGSGEGANIKVNFPNTPIRGIIPVYQQITGKKMILDGQLDGETLKIMGPRPMNKKEAVAFIEACLLLNGYAVIDVDDETVKIIHWSGGKSPTTAGLPVYTSLKDLPTNEKIVHFVLPLQNISPEEATKAFSTVIKLDSYGAITPVNNTANIIITENTATIRSICELAQVIDVPPAEIANEIIDLKRSDAEKVADIVKEIYEEKEKAESTVQYRGAHGVNPSAPQNVASPVQQVSLAPGSSTNGSTNPTAAKVKVIPDRRTNSLLVIARPVDITYIRTLVEKLDRESTDTNFLERKLKYMPVTEFLAVAKDALSKNTDISSESGTSGGTSGGTTKGTRSRRTGTSTNTPSTDAAQRNNQAYGNNNNTGFGGAGGGANGSRSGQGAPRSSLGDPEQSGAPESVVVGKTLLIADARSNTLIVSGSPEDVQTIDKLIERMDLRPQQIYISTIIAQVNLGKTDDYGFDFVQGLNDFTLQQGQLATAAAASGTSTTTAATSTVGSLLGTGTGSTTTTSTIGLQAAGTPGLMSFPLNHKFNLYGQIGTLGSYIHALQGNNNVKLLSRPCFYLRNNEKAVISSGQRIAVPVSTLSNVGAGVGNTASVSSSIDYRDVVLKLEVIPLINSNDEVTLQIAQVNDSITGSQAIGGNQVPTIGTQELQTTVTLKNGSTVVLGGLITENTTDNQDGVPILRSIPIIKNLFNRTQKQKTRQETLIFIQPSIIKSTDPLDMPNTLEAGRSTVLQEGLQFADERPEVRRALPMPR